MRINDHHFTERHSDLHRKNQSTWNKWKKPVIYTALASAGAVGLLLACRTLSPSTPTPPTPKPPGNENPDPKPNDASGPETPISPSECCISYRELGIETQECDVDCPSLPPGSTLLPSPSQPL